jgi:hypothetical protein
VASARHNFAEAHAEYARRRVQGRAPKNACDPLIDAAFDAMKARTVDPLAPNTIAQYEIAASKLKKILQNFTPTQVMPKHAAAIKLALIKTPNMCNRVLSFGRGVFAHALEHQLVELNPFVGIRATRRRSAPGSSSGTSGGRSAPWHRAGCSW